MTADVTDDRSPSWIERHPVLTFALFAGLVALVVIVARRKGQAIVPLPISNLVAPVSTIVPWTPLP